MLPFDTIRQIPNCVEVWEVALVDLLESLENAARSLDRMHAFPDYAMQLRESKRQIEDAISTDNQGLLKILLARDIAGLFLYGMGSFGDLLICKDNNNVPPDMTEDEAMSILEKVKEDLVFNLLFWDTNLRKATKLRRKMWGKRESREKRRYEREMRRYDKMKKKGTPIPLPAPPLPLWTAFHIDPHWFEGWTDWGKLAKHESI